MTHRMRAILLTSMAAALGCGSGTPANRGSVHGMVTVDGQPAKAGAISFSPKDGMSPTAGGEIVEGRYKVDVPLGLSAVAVRVPKVTGQKKLYDTPDSPVQPIMTESLPAKYNDETELTLDVKVGDNEQNYDLKTK